MSAPLVLAVPAKGRLQENAEAFFARSGLNLIKPRGARDYRGAIAGLDGVEVAYLSASEITSQLAAGAVHFGVTGEDLVREMIPDADSKVVLIEGLGFGFATVVVAVPQAWIDVRTMADIDDVGTSFRHAHGRKMRVATKYINLTREYFSAHGIVDYRIVESTGATEGAPAAGTAELIVDITTTGATLAANGLKIVEDGIILRSQANLVAARTATWGDAERETARVILDRIAAQQRARAFREVRARFAACDAKLVDSAKQKVRRRNAVRRADLLGHADAALPAGQGLRAHQFPARERRGSGGGGRSRTTCSRATIRSTPSSKRRCSFSFEQRHIAKRSILPVSRAGAYFQSRSRLNDRKSGIHATHVMPHWRPEMTYYFAKSLDVPFAQAVEKTIAALKAHGFGVLTKIDVQATLEREDRSRIPSLRDPRRLQSENGASSAPGRG